jgi:hypothetical protein
MQKAKHLNSLSVDAVNVCGSDGVKSIKPTTGLPAINEPVTINGYIQLGASPNRLKQATRSARLALG